MKIDLSNVIHGSEPISYFSDTFHDEEINNFSDEFEIDQPIDIQGSISKVDGTNMLEAKINYFYKTKCDRCLNPTKIKITTILSGILVEGTNKPDDYIEDENEEYIHFEKDTLDLKDYILDQVASSLPMKSLCHEDCKGLCPRCGADLNKESCNCDTVIIDPRLEKLKNFFPKE